MPEPVSTTLGIGVLVSSLGHLLAHLGLHVAGHEAHHKYLHFRENFESRFLAGALPANEHILHALHRSLAGTTLVVGYTLHDPDRKLLKHLLREKADWTNFKVFLHHFHELVRGNIIPENLFGGDMWLAKLIELAHDPSNFHDFDTSIILPGGSSDVLRTELDALLAARVHDEFLAWTEKNVRVYAPKPPAFEASIRDGLQLAGEGTSKLSFYAIFCLFLKEELKEKTPAYRAYVI